MKNNPFLNNDPDRQYLWEMLVARDIKAFIAQDWNMVKYDFLEEEFMGIDAGKQEDVDRWELKYATLEAYRNEWLLQAKYFSEIELNENKEDALYRVTEMRKIDISGRVALLHKKFIGSFGKKNGEQEPTNWRTIYRCRKVNGIWKIIGFTGYLPLYSSISDSL